MLDEIQRLIEETKPNILSMTQEQQEVAYRDIINQMVSVIIVAEISSDSEEADLMEQCDIIMEDLAAMFGRETWLIEDDISAALETVPYDDLETSQELASRNRLN